VLVFGALAAVTRETQAQCVVEVFLDQGWNMVSLPLEPDDPTITSLLGPLISDQSLQRVYAFDAPSDQWLVYIPSYVDLLMPLGVSNLLEIHAGNGYWIQVTQACSFDVWGTPTQPTLAIANGWNLVGTSSLEEKTWDMFLGGFEPNLESLWIMDGNYLGLSFETAPPTGDVTWLRPARAVWIQADSAFALGPPQPERVFPFSAGSTGASVGAGGAGIAGTPWPYRYSEYTFESAGFDIDRAPLGCYGEEDTDAWDPEGKLVLDDSGFPIGRDYYIDPPVPGRFKMLINIGSPVIGSASEPGGAGYSITVGGGNMFLLANRPESVPPVPAPQTVMTRALAVPASSDQKETEQAANPQ
jgi:hypothetical protein